MSRSRGSCPVAITQDDGAEHVFHGCRRRKSPTGTGRRLPPRQRATGARVQTMAKAASNAILRRARPRHGRHWTGSHSSDGHRCPQGLAQRSVAQAIAGAGARATAWPGNHRIRIRRGPLAHDVARIGPLAVWWSRHIPGEGTTLARNVTGTTLLAERRRRRLPKAARLPSNHREWPFRPGERRGRDPNPGGAARSCPTCKRGSPIRQRGHARRRSPG